MPSSKLLDFFEGDFPYTLFPLQTNLLMLKHAEDDLLEYAYQKITPHEPADSTFLIQERATATKQRLHLRRTFKLDPVAEIFLYDIVLRHRSKFRKKPETNRRSFGYVFSNGEPASSSESYKSFKQAFASASFLYDYTAEFDIAAYFNSVYHHDLVRWFQDLSLTEDDASIFGKFLRQINAGRSIDCLVQGIYPAKVIGARLLDFLEYQPTLEADIHLRFMDDFALFSNDLGKLQRDFIRIQKLLGERGLSINPSKTYIGPSRNKSVESEIEPVRRGLLRRRRVAVRSLYWDDNEDEDDDSEAAGLTEDEREYLISLLQADTMTEEDADLVLAYLRDRGDDLLIRLGEILWRFPYLAKNVFLFSSFVTDKDGLIKALTDFTKKNEVVTEYSLFWIACIVERHLLTTRGVESLIAALYEHQDATRISRAKLLEIAEKRFGLRELREENLRTGSSDWLSWSSAIGSRSEAKTNRNHLLTYFAHGSELNRLIAKTVKAL